MAPLAPLRSAAGLDMTDDVRCEFFAFSRRLRSKPSGMGRRGSPCTVSTVTTFSCRLVRMARRIEGCLQRPVRLPAVAPRPFEDEFLGCWRLWMASHYSSPLRQVENWICGASGASKPHLLSHDVPTEQSATRLGALACRLRHADVEQLSLPNTGCSRASFVSDPVH